MSAASASETRCYILVFNSGDVSLGFLVLRGAEL